MKRSHVLSAGLALVALTVAAAQQEQWLEYQTLSEPQGYQWLELSTNAPAEVALPADLQPGAMFTRWKNGYEKNDGRLICLGRSVKGGAFNRLYADANGNGRIDDDKPLDFTGRSGQSFPPVKFTFKGEDGPISYHLNLRYYQFDRDRSQLLAASGCCYEGRVDFGGKKLTLAVLDTTLNGVFNDKSNDEDRADSVRVGSTEGPTRSLGDMIEVEGQLYTIEVARDGAYVKVNKAEGVQMGVVQLPEGVTSFSAIGRPGNFTRSPEKTECKLPVGKYRVQSYQLKRKDAKNVQWRLSGYGGSKLSEFVVSADNPVRVAIGEPLRAVLDATEEKSRVQFGLKLRGNLGETVDIMKGDQRPRAPQLLVSDFKGTYKSTNTFEYG